MKDTGVVRERKHGAMRAGGGEGKGGGAEGGEGGGIGGASKDGAMQS